LEDVKKAGPNGWPIGRRRGVGRPYEVTRAVLDRYERHLSSNKSKGLRTSVVPPSLTCR